MTLPNERTRAVLNVEKEARRLHDAYCWRGATFANIPREEWLNFMRLFRHYPTSFDLSESARKCPEIWGEPE